jgi:hypothetical protein
MCKLDPDSNSSMFKLIVSLLCGKAFGKITNSAFDFQLKILHKTMPNSGLPKSLYDIKFYIKVVGLGYQRIYVCNNNCVLFWKDYEKPDVFP